MCISLLTGSRLVCVGLRGDCRGLPGVGKLPQLLLGSELLAQQGEVNVPKPPLGFPVPRLFLHSKVPCIKAVSQSGKTLSCTVSFLFSSSQNAVALSLHNYTVSSEQGKARARQRPSQGEPSVLLHSGQSLQTPLLLLSSITLSGE